MIAYDVQRRRSGSTRVEVGIVVVVTLQPFLTPTGKEEVELPDT